MQWGSGKSDGTVVLHFEGSWNQDHAEFQDIQPRISECLDQVDHGEKKYEVLVVSDGVVLSSG